MEEKIARMRDLIPVLQKASRAYYAQDTEIMSNFEYDRLYDELQALEAETGIVLSGSPSVTVGYEAVDALPKERHEKPMLSLAKTKEREELKSWLGDKEGLLSWKLDGLTIVLTYEGGHTRKRGSRRSHYTERQSVPEYTGQNPISGKSGAAWGSSYSVFRV